MAYKDLQASCITPKALQQLEPRRYPERERWETRKVRTTMRQNAVKRGPHPDDTVCPGRYGKYAKYALIYGKYAL